MNFGALYKRPPSSARPVHSVAFTGTSTSATLTGVASECGETAGGWYTFTPSQDCHILWGDATVAAATTSDMLYPANVSFDMWLSRKLESHLTVIRDTTSGTLYWHKSES